MTPLTLLALATSLAAGAHARLFSVELHVPRYVPLNGSAVLRCAYDVKPDVLHKVEWLHGNDKMYQFVRNRTPPFRLYHVTGADIDRERSNETEILLSGLQLSASGFYSCEVSTQTPIFTKASNDEELTVIQPQRGAPLLRVRRSAYAVGELLEANCTSRPAHPVPHVTWLLNGDPVPESYVKYFPMHQQHGDGVGVDEDDGGLGSATVQLSMPVEFTLAAADNLMHLSCVATIPAFLGRAALPAHYADYQREDATVEVLPPEIPTSHQQPRAAVSFPVFLAVVSSRRLLHWR